MAGVVPGRRFIVPAIATVLVALGTGAQAGASDAQGATSGAQGAVSGVQVVVPGLTPISAGAHAAPPSSQSWDGAFAYPDDGSIVHVAAVSGQVSAGVRGSTASAASDLQGVSLFGGEITADAVSARVSATLKGTAGTADFNGTGVTNLIVLGQAVMPGADLSVPVGDWGHLVVLAEEQGSSATNPPTAHGSVTVLKLTLDAAHATLPAGTSIVVGYAAASAEATIAPVAPKAAPPPPPPPPPPPVRPLHPRPSREAGRLGRPIPPDDGAQPFFLPFPVLPPALQPGITAEGYVFPVYGPSGYGDSFQAPRSDVPGGWHHGDDIFAPLGAPVLAVADGTVFSVGRNRIGGNRLWLQDDLGNQYYYAHLSAYTPLASNGLHVRAGDVLGFVGNTGDAAGGPYHLHFEIHPATLLFLGYDGVVDPTPYLDAWRRLRDVRFPAGVAWAPQPFHSNLPAPGAMLLQSTDISTASGLDPGSLERVLRTAAGEGDGG
jgi:murein DD-endopeptidase MepM/ murein hydrolase activator NlpD